jgi:glucose-6-phosphate 1-dehydrogenase
MNKKWNIVIFGASGDLSKRYLLPALYKMLKKEQHHFIVTGTASSSLSSQQLIDRARPFINDIQESVLEKLVHLVSYQIIDFSVYLDFEKLHKHLIERENGEAYNRLLYLATPANYFCTITEYCAQAGIIKKGNKGDRIAYEKPFGWDLSSAREINSCIKKYLDYEQVYRIDHYLTKELVSTIAWIRFANIFFESLWNKEFIKYIEINLSEKISIENRGTLYDPYGALKDVVQNHMLQLAALTAMDRPDNIFDESIKEKKAAVLQTMKIVDGVLGQYKGYRKEKGVNACSNTETYAALKLMIATPRWKGVPFYLVTGKCLTDKKTFIRIVFKEVERCPLDKAHCSSNILTIRIAPDEGFSLMVNTKRPYSIHESMSVAMDFCYACLFGFDTPDAYEVLLHEIMMGERSIAVRSDEIEFQWSIIEEMKKLNLPLYYYEQGSQGPPEAIEWLTYNQGKKL